METRASNQPEQTIGKTTAKPQLNARSLRRALAVLSLLAVENPRFQSEFQRCAVRVWRTAANALPREKRLILHAIVNGASSVEDIAIRAKLNPKETTRHLRVLFGAGFVIRRPVPGQSRRGSQAEFSYWPSVT